MKSIKNMIKHLLGMDKNSIEALRSRGVRIGKNCSINTDYIDYGHGFLVSIGDNVTIAVNAMILTHDASTKPFLGYSKIGSVSIGNDVFIGGGMYHSSRCHYRKQCNCWSRQCSESLHT